MKLLPEHGSAKVNHEPLSPFGFEKRKNSIGQARRTTANASGKYGLLPGWMLANCLRLAPAAVHLFVLEFFSWRDHP